MASLAASPSPTPAPSLPHPSAHSRSPTLHGRTLFQRMILRYFALPPVKAWLLSRHPRSITTAHALNTSFSYACMYYPPSFIPRGSAPYPLPKPFLDIGDCLLCHHVYDGVAVGTLYNSNEEHALSIVRDSMLKNSRLSRRPRTRNFAIDLRVRQLEVVEFAWMEDDSLIIACRRLIPSGFAERPLVLSSDMLFYDPIPPNSMPEVPLMRMTLREKPIFCQFCGLRGFKTCTCPASFKRRASTAADSSPSSSSTASPTSSSGTAPAPGDEPTGPLAQVIGSWENYTKSVFSCCQSGAFFTNWYRRSRTGGMDRFLSPRHPIPYQFICGQRSDTLKLASLYVYKMRLCDRSLSADTRLYGGGLSRGSDIGMLMDKQDETLQPPYTDDGDFESLIEATLLPEVASDEVVSSGISTRVASSTVPSGATLSQGTVASEEHGQFLSSAEVPSATIHLEAQPSEDSSLLSTKLSRKSPCTTLIDRDEAVVPPSVPDMAHTRPDRLHHIMETAYEHWGDNGSSTRTASQLQAQLQQQQQQYNQQQLVLLQQQQQVKLQQQLQQRKQKQRKQQQQLFLNQRQITLSTTSRKLQAFMTVDASGTPTCTKCDRSFPKRGNLGRHIQTVHLKLKPFQCDMCTAKFGYKTHLKRHQAVHKRNGEYRCAICNRDFRGQLHLNRHVQQAHRQHSEPVNGEGKVACFVCGGTCLPRMCTQEGTQQQFVY